ncbi:MAG TPA: uracil-DNA glycosylase [Clostridiales bacterium]|nr:uracil-DNA glycosylase [Clostridiales bacterium]
MEWNELMTKIRNCRRCSLCQSRTQVVLGRGNPHARLLFIGEGPGEQEDRQGQPFVGPAGKLLDNLLDALGYEPEDYYIANVVKCRPPGNRNPLEQEVDACMPFLREQFRLIRPAIIVCLGSIASRYIIDKNLQITQTRGIWVERKGCRMMPTFHPAALLRDPGKRVPLYIDLKAVKEALASG